MRRLKVGSVVSFLVDIDGTEPDRHEHHRERLHECMPLHQRDTTPQHVCQKIFFWQYQSIYRLR
jgi:hypothetical protein